mmetsp:Transcript_57947/g.152614  ORF Transcript_57947/g.152614 Transcript_57947/m.152614 type:complete len:230 (-) Transcript_57947:50-739(-)
MPAMSRPARAQRARSAAWTTVCAALLLGAAWGAASRAWVSPAAAQEASNRRSFLAAAGMAAAVAAGPMALPQSALAYGPVKMPFTDIRYEEVACKPDKGETLKGTRATFGLVARCVQVTGKVVNPTGGALKRPGVFGRINDKKAQTSVLANAMDGASDVGQLTIIDKIEAGEVEASFRFVAALPKTYPKDSLPALQFSSLAAIWYPGGNRFEPITSCELYPETPGCDPP